MQFIRLSLQNRVVWLLGASLVALQLALGYSFDRALDQSQDERAAALARSAHTSVNFAVATAFHRQRDGLEMFAGWARHQASSTVISSKKKRAPNFFQRVFGRALPPEPTPEPIRLATRIKGLVEYADSRPVIWYLNTDALPDLSKEMQGTARRLKTQANSISRSMFCGDADCVLVSVRPFTTPDKARIIAVAAESLEGILSSLGASAGYQLRMQIVKEIRGPGQGGGGIDFDRMIGGVSMDVPRLRMQVKQDAAFRLRDMRRRYYLIAGLGVPLSLLLVAALLRPLVERVGVLRVALPKLTEGDFGAATALLREAQAKARVRDETTELMRTAEDITGRLQGMQSDLTRQAADLRRERDHMQLLLDTTPACIVLLEGAGRIASANEMASTALKVPRASLVGRDILDFLELEPRAGFISLIQAAAEGGPTSPLEFEFKDSEGARHIMEWRLAPLPEDSQRRILAVGTDVTRLREVERRLIWLRTHDEATTLLNRRSIEQSVASLPGVRCLLLVRPKNESALHDMLNEAGRADLQQQIADRLRTITQLYPGSEAALLDGFQFAVLVHSSREAVEAQLPRFAEVQRPALLDIGGKPVEVELLLQGIELDEPAWRENITDQLDALLKLAATLDSAVHWLTLETLREREQEDYRHWVNEIDAALKSDRVTIFYQPIFDAKTLETSHSEVLVRMIGRDGAIIPPSAFLRAAERSGQIRQIDRVVFAKAIGTLLDLQARGVRHNLSVNLSAPALQEPYLTQMIDDAISLRGLEPGRLMLELVETQAINTLESAVQLMLKFKRQGIQMMLDDFGIGFTSFEYLRELPFAYVKIDQLFVKHLAKRSDDRSLIRSIHEMVRGLGRKTIAEGVEDAASLRILQKIGVDAVQGFGLARPGREINLARASLGH